jgi:hypothetical protein
MDTTATFSNRSNARRAAEKMIANGTAPAVDYGFKTREDGRFEIVWQTAVAAGDADPFARIRASEAIQALGTTPEKYAGLDTAAEALAVHKDWLRERAAPNAATHDEAGTEIASASATADGPAASGEPALSESAPITAQPEPENKWPDGAHVMVRDRRSWSEATIYKRLDREYWRVQYPSGGAGMFKEGDIRAYDAERDAKPARQPRRRKASAPRKAARSSYAIDPDAIAAGKLPDKAPVVTSAANQLYQKKFDALHAHAVAGEWDAVRDFKITGSNSYSKMVERYRQDLLAVHKAQAEASVC